MKVLNKKVYRDIWRNKSQFISIFLMAMLGVLAFAGVHAYMDGMKYSGDKFYEEYNLQDLWLAGENFKEEDLEEIKNIDNVKDAERKLTMSATANDFEDTVYELNFIETNNISKFYVVDGVSFDINNSGIWLDSFFAKNKNLKVGDKISFTYKTFSFTKEIVGLINVPDHVYAIKDDTAIFPTHQDYAFVYLSINSLSVDVIMDEVIKTNPLLANMDKSTINSMIEANINEYRIFPYIMVDLEDTSKINETKELLENIKAVKAVTTREDSLSYQGYQSEIEEGQTYSSVFTLLFLFIATLSVVTTMYRFVRKQRTQIGTMKALGIKKSKIIAHYVSFGFWISLLASVTGIVLGITTIGQFFLDTEMAYFEVPNSSVYIIKDVYILAAATVVLITFITYLSCRSILKEKAADALRVEVPKVKQSKLSLSTRGIFKKASLSTKWNLRDISRNKGRTLMASVGIIGCTMILVAAFGMLDTMNSFIDWQFKKIYHFEYKLAIEENISPSLLSQLEEKYGNATSQTLGIEFMDGDTKKANTLTINDAEGKLQYTNHDKNVITLNNDGVFITEKLSETLNKKVGDEIKWHIFGEDTWYVSKISGINRDPQNQSFSTTRTYIESNEIGLEYKPDTIYTNVDLSGVKEINGISKISGIENIKTGMLSMIGTVRSMIVLLIVISAILGFVIIYNLGTLSFAEKQYQFATLKVLGYKSKQIKKIFIKQNAWISVVSTILGLPLGYAMIAYVFKSALGDNYDFPAYIKFATYIYATVGTLLVSFVVNKFLSKKVESIDMVSSLKGNE